MKHYSAFLVVLCVFCITYSPSTTAQTDRPLADYPVITADNVSQLEQLKVLGEGYIRQVIFSPDEQLVAMATSVGIWLYVADDLQNPIRLFGNYEIDVTYVMFNADGSRLFGGVQGGSVYIWDVVNGESIAILQAEESEWGLGMLGMELSDDEQLLYLIHDESLRIWNLRSNTLFKSIANSFGCEANYSISSKFLSPDKFYFLGLCLREEYNPDAPKEPIYSSTIKLIAIETGEVHSIEHNRAIWRLGFNETGTQLIARFRDGYLGVWDTESRTLLYEFGESQLGYKNPAYGKIYHYPNMPLNPSRYSEIGILTEDESKFIDLMPGFITIWDIQTNTILHKLQTQSSPITGRPFRPYETLKIIQSTNEAEAMQLIESYDVMNRIPLSYDSDALQIYRSPQFNYFIGLSNDLLLVWDTDGNELVNSDFTASCKQVRSTQLSLNNTRLLDYHYDVACIWDTENGELLYTMPITDYQPSASENYFFTVSKSEDDEDRVLKLWDFRTDTFVELIRQDDITMPAESAISTNEEFVVAFDGRNIFAWDIQTQSIITSFQVTHSGFGELTISSNDEFIAFHTSSDVMNSSQDNHIYVWDTESRTQLYEIDKYYEEFISCLSFSTQGKFLLVGYEGMADLWDAQSGEFITTLVDGCPNFSNQSRYFNYTDSQIALWGVSDINTPSTINVFSTDSFEIIYRFDLAGDFIESIVFSPITNLLLVVVDDMLQVWDTDNGMMLYNTIMLTGIRWAEFNTDGNLIITEMKDGTIRIWGVNDN